jgi:hypothetical protein
MSDRVHRLENRSKTSVRNSIRYKLNKGKQHVAHTGVVKHDFVMRNYF